MASAKQDHTPTSIASGPAGVEPSAEIDRRAFTMRSRFLASNDGLAVSLVLC